MSHRSPCGDAVRESAAKLPAVALVSASIVSQHERSEKERERYADLRHGVGRSVLTVGRQKPRSVAIRAEVDVHAFRAFEPRANDAQLATTRKSGIKVSSKSNQVRTRSTGIRRVSKLLKNQRVSGNHVVDRLNSLT